ncbi:MAG: sensor histidine kinase, partial [Hyphomicrobium sp.]
SRTRVAVESSDDLPAVGSNLMLASVYRFVQEGLNNAVRHAGGKGQTVLARRENDMLILEVADQGPGMAEPAAPSSGQRLGLIGLRERIEALGGCLKIASNGACGTRLTAHIPLMDGGEAGVTQRSSTQKSLPA